MVRTSSRRGLTRTEVVCVAAMIVALIGLLLPAVQRARAQANGNRCAFNLGQIAFAAHNYASAHIVFPPGMDNQYVGTLIHLLPFLDQEIVWRNFSFDPRYSLYWDNPHNRPPTRPKTSVSRPPDVYGCEWEVRAYLCPDGPQPEQTVTALLVNRHGIPGTDYRTNDGLDVGFLYTGHPGRLIMARSHYLGMAGDWRYGGRYRGIFGFNTRTRIADIVDGTSNTLFFAETWGSHHDWRASGGIRSGWTVASRSAGFNYAAFGSCPDRANPNCDFDDSFGLGFGAFGALHPRPEVPGFNVAFADGSVRTLPGNISLTRMWLPMCGMRDGDLLGPVMKVRLALPLHD